MKFLHYTAILLFGFSFTLNSDSIEKIPKNIKFFHWNNLSSIPIAKLEKSNIKIEIYDVSLQNRIEQALSKGLSNHPNQAADQAKNRIKSNNENIKKALESAMIIQFLIWEHQITRLPAVLIDDTYLIYDSEDINLLIQTWNYAQ